MVVGPVMVEIVDSTVDFLDSVKLLFFIPFSEDKDSLWPCSEKSANDLSNKLSKLSIGELDAFFKELVAVVDFILSTGVCILCKCFTCISFPFVSCNTICLTTGSLFIVIGTTFGS